MAPLRLTFGLRRSSSRAASIVAPTRQLLLRRNLATVTALNATELEETEGIPPPLAGIKILDLTSALSGPSATQYLGDLGADVWKLEVPRKGDDTRHWGPPFLKHTPDAPEKWSTFDFESSFFACTNRNKRSLTVDLKKPEGLAIAKQLAEKADIVIENLISGKLKKIGLGYDEVAKTNPGVIYCSITGYGQTGTYATAPGYDAIVAGEAGIIHCTGEPDRLPVRPQVAVADHAAGFNAYGAILAALIARKKTGKGMNIDVSMFDCQVAGLANAASQWLNLGVEYTRTNTASPLAAPYQVFDSKDSSLTITVSSDEQFKKFVEVVKLPSLASDSRYTTNNLRLKNVDSLAETIQARILEETTDYWIDLLVKHGFAVGTVNNLAATFAHPQTIARGMISEVAHPYVGTVRIASPPVVYNGQRMKTRYAPPALGVHTREILSEELGMKGEEIDRLKSEGII